VATRWGIMPRKKESEDDMSFAMRCFNYGFKAYEIGTENHIETS
jgi:hypothetical protein